MPEHSDLLRAFSSLGYKNAEGLCYGAFIRWLEACLANKEGEFARRVNY